MAGLARRILRKREEEYYDSPFAAVARWLLARGVHPNHFTFLQLPVYAAQIYAALHLMPWLFCWLMAAIIFLDAGDGILARVGNLQTKAGAVLDSTFDTLGIAIVMWGATKFYPEHTAWLMSLFFGNVMLFLQNALLEEKVIAYLRGPVLTAVAFPATLYQALVLASIVIGFLLIVRTPAMLRALVAEKPVSR